MNKEPSHWSDMLWVSVELIGEDAIVLQFVELSFRWRNGRLAASVTNLIDRINTISHLVFAQWLQDHAALRKKRRSVLHLFEWIFINRKDLVASCGVCFGNCLHLSLHEGGAFNSWLGPAFFQWKLFGCGDKRLGHASTCQFLQLVQLTLILSC